MDRPAEEQRGRRLKRGAPEHPKTIDLARRLSIDRWGAVGLLELLWHTAAKHHPEGRIGKWSNHLIATSLYWTGDAELLVQALVDAGFLDANTEDRLVIHDWLEHADDTVKKYLKRRAEAGHDQTSPDMAPSRARALPTALCPLPLATEEEERIESFALSPHESGNGVSKVPVLVKGPTPFDRFWQAYPRKTGKGAAEKAWAKMKPPIEAVLAAIEWQRTSTEWLREGGQFIPHPSTWINQKRWLDEPPPDGPVLSGQEAQNLEASRRWVGRKP